MSDFVRQGASEIIPCFFRRQARRTDKMRVDDNTVFIRCRRAGEGRRAVETAAEVGHPYVEIMLAVRRRGGRVQHLF